MNIVHSDASRLFTERRVPNGKRQLFATIIVMQMLMIKHGPWRVSQHEAQIVRFMNGIRKTKNA